MPVAITWQGWDLYLNREHSGGDPLLILTQPDQQRIVVQWAAQADSLPDFLEMLHLEGLIDLDTLRQLLVKHAPLDRIWQKVREFCQLAGDIGEYPAHLILVSHGRDFLADTATWLSPLCLREADRAWTRFEAGEHAALHSAGLWVVLSVLGCLAGQRLGLCWPHAVAFGDWVSALITNCTMGHGNDREVLRLEEIASYVVYGTTQRVGRACVDPEVWHEYRPGVAAAVRALQSGF